MEVTRKDRLISVRSFSNICVQLTLILLVTCDKYSFVKSSSESDLGVLLSSHADSGLGEVNASLLSAPVSRRALPGSAYSKLVPASDIVSSCKAFIDAFSVAAANYTGCAIHFARPIHFCQNCVTQYVEALDVYERIMNGIALLDETKQDCGDMILNSDRIQIIVQTADFIQKLWSDGKCDNCFAHSENGSVVYGKLSNETLHFQALANQTTECFHYHEMPNGTVSNTTVVCHNCSGVYRELNKFYSHIEEEHPGDVCMDIVDAMNQTRGRWSRQFQCVQPTADLLAVLLLSGFFSLLPLVFYIGNKIHGTNQAKQIVRQKRLRDVTSSLADPPSTTDQQ